MLFINTPHGRLQIEDPPTSSKKFSHLYGFRGTEPEPEEQAVIRYVVESIASSTEPIEQVVENLVKDLNNKGIRRSQKRWLYQTVIALVRPVFGGRIETPNGFVLSKHYSPPIVPWEVMSRALSKSGRTSE